MGGEEIGEEEMGNAPDSSAQLKNSSKRERNQVFWSHYAESFKRNSKLQFLNVGRNQGKQPLGTYLTYVLGVAGKGEGVLGTRKNRRKETISGELDWIQSSLSKRR